MGFSFTQKQTDLLIGTLLGNGSLQTTNGQTWRYEALHKAIHKSYIEHKYDVLKNYCNHEPTYTSVYDEERQKFYQRYSFTTLESDELRFFGNLFYTKHNGKWIKTIPPNIRNYLTPAALAYWYMDEGALKWKGQSNAVRLCTDSFQEFEVKRLKDALIKNFDLKCFLQTKNNICRISILETSYPELKELIVPHLLPCMYYKFPDGNKGVLDNEDISNDLINTFIERKI
jgi:hypothetical protein